MPRSIRPFTPFHENGRRGCTRSCEAAGSCSSHPRARALPSGAEGPIWRVGHRGLSRADPESGRVLSRVIIRFLAECGTARSAAVIRELDTVLLGAG